MSYENLFSAELLTRVQEGDEEAFGELYEHLIGPVYRFALFRIGEARAAEQATEEIFLKIWKNFRKFDLQGKTAFPVWIFAGARQSLNHFLAERKKLTPERRQMLQERSGSTGEENSEYQSLLTAFQEAPAAQTEAIILKYFCHLSNAEIALILEKTEGAIRILQSRGLKRLREILDEEEAQKIPLSPDHD